MPINSYLVEITNGPDDCTDDFPSFNPISELSLYNSLAEYRPPSPFETVKLNKQFPIQNISNEDDMDGFCLPTPEKKIKIFFDFDDTLYPSNWLKKFNITSFDNFMMILEYKAKLNEFTSKMINLLKFAKTLGEVIIITNAQLVWIDTVIKHCFTPEDRNVFSTIRIISAQDRHKSKYDVYPLTNTALKIWKKYAFFEEIQNCNGFTKVISIGDSDAEKDAIKEVILFSKIHPDNCKTVKFPEGPSIEDLGNTLHKLELNLEFYINNQRYNDFFI
jgi:hypothetical protein